jgi:cyclopropane fatty-acyl-phospholipid synthase-like methyltransferase
MPRNELYKFCNKMETLLNPNGILLIEFMTTTKETKCHPFFDKFIFPDGAQFTLDTAINTFEKNRNLRLKSINCLDNNYYKTIHEWNIRLLKNKEKCIELLDGNIEKYKSFELYLKWAEFLYKCGRSRCYTCIWEKI